MKKTFLVCSKGMYFDEAFDTSVKLIEWIEILKAYGVTKVHGVQSLHFFQLANSP